MDYMALLNVLVTAVVSGLITFGTALVGGSTTKQAASVAGTAAITAISAHLRQSPVPPKA